MPTGFERLRTARSHVLAAMLSASHARQQLQDCLAEQGFPHKLYAELRKDSDNMWLTGLKFDGRTLDEWTRRKPRDAPSQSNMLNYLFSALGGVVTGAVVARKFGIKESLGPQPNTQPNAVQPNTDSQILEKAATTLEAYKIFGERIAAERKTKAHEKMVQVTIQMLAMKQKVLESEEQGRRAITNSMLANKRCVSWFEEKERLNNIITEGSDETKKSLAQALQTNVDMVAAHEKSKKKIGLLSEKLRTLIVQAAVTKQERDEAKMQHEQVAERLMQTQEKCAEHAQKGTEAREDIKAEKAAKGRSDDKIALLSAKLRALVVQVGATKQERDEATMQHKRVTERLVQTQKKCVEWEHRFQVETVKLDASVQSDIENKRLLLQSGNNIVQLEAAHGKSKNEIQGLSGKLKAYVIQAAATKQERDEAKMQHEQVTERLMQTQEKCVEWHELQRETKAQLDQMGRGQISFQSSLTSALASTTDLITRYANVEKRLGLMQQNAVGFKEISFENIVSELGEFKNAFDRALKGLELKTVLTYNDGVPALDARIKSINGQLNTIEQRISVLRQDESAARDQKRKAAEEQSQREIEALQEQLGIIGDNGDKESTVGEMLQRLNTNYEARLETNRREFAAANQAIQTGSQELAILRQNYQALTQAHGIINASNLQQLDLNRDLQIKNGELTQRLAQATERDAANQERLRQLRQELERINGGLTQQGIELTAREEANQRLQMVIDGQTQELASATQRLGQLQEFERINGGLTGALAEQGRALAEREAENQKLRDVIASHAQELVLANQQHQSELNRIGGEQGRALAECDAKKQQLQSTISAQATELKKHKETIEKGRGADALGRQQLSKFTEELESANRELQESQQALGAKVKELESANKQLQDSAQANQAARLALEEKDRQLAEQRAAPPQFGVKMEDDCESRLASQTRTLASTTKKLTSATEKLTNLQNELKSVNEQVANSRGEIEREEKRAKRLRVRALRQKDENPFQWNQG